MERRQLIIGISLALIGLGGTFASQVAPEIFRDSHEIIFFAGIALMVLGILLAVYSAWHTTPKLNEVQNLEPSPGGEHTLSGQQQDHHFSPAIKIRKAGNIKIHDNYLPGQVIYEGDEAKDVDVQRNRSS
ncbi:Ycf66 family protein [Paracoccus sp. 08]|uniref:Ycf66 family protein n=1 Tax=Paracoccus sp. 08 TaxID=2606624 RepID=UPI002095FE8C|nr:Ycf66 family protein [Paracoccus sp. 08]MCO6361893.1 hypothetical protein [Paracoccus sp. 08]